MTDLHRIPQQHRQEGFPGQQIAVASPSISLYMKEKMIDRFIPAAAGYFPRAQGHFVQRNITISDAIFLLCIDGKGWLEIDGNRLQIQAGDVGFIPSSLPHAYGSGADKPWSLAWFHVKGDEVNGVAEVLELNQTSPTRHVGALERDLPIVDELCRLLRPPNQLAQLRIASLLLREWFARAAERCANAAHEASLVDRLNISVNWMRTNLHRPIRLVDLAGQAQLSVSRYSEVFRQLFGRPPIEYCTACRIGAACELLATTDAQIGVIAEKVGYADALHFSKVFRREMGTSPSHYRKIQGQSQSLSI
ncbi:MAG: AraC family transcriptional regulator [Planctomycetota bacterium]